MDNDRVRVGMGIHLNEDVMGFSGNGEVVGISSSFPGVTIWIVLMDEPVPPFEHHIHGTVEGVRGITLTPDCFSESRMGGT